MLNTQRLRALEQQIVAVTCVCASDATRCHVLTDAGYTHAERFAQEVGAWN